MVQCHCKVSELVSQMITDFSPRHLEIDGVSTPSGSEFEPDELGVESEQNKESLDDRRPDSSEAIYTKRGPKAMLKATRDAITQACSSCAPIPTAVSSGGKRACGGTLDGPG